MQKEKCIVLYYKPQNKTNASSPFLKENNFVLILMNDAQAKVFKKKSGSNIAFDGTQGARYDFHLLTVIILDELHQGFLTPQ